MRGQGTSKSFLERQGMGDASWGTPTVHVHLRLATLGLELKENRTQKSPV